jgi:glycosyltransferase involved in cell wall biosynthesis
MQNFMRANDVIFFEWASELLALASHLPKTCGIVTRLHRYEMYQWVDRINWDAVDKIILVSQAKVKEFTARFPQQAPKVVMIYEAVSLNRFQFQPRPFNGDIGILCHITPRKRVYELILTFYETLQENGNLRLHIGGDEHVLFGDYYQAIRVLIEKLGLEDKVIFYDFIKRPEEWYHTIDIFISNSYSEGLQVSPMEAMACGCYCLSHHWDGADELLPVENLYFTDNQLKERILEYSALPQDEKQRRLADLQKMVADRFNVDQTKVAVRRVIEEAVLKP